MHDLVTWYKITHAGEQVAQWDLQNNTIRTSPPGPAFVLEVPLCNLLASFLTGLCKGPIKFTTYFHMNDFAKRLVLTQRQKATLTQPFVLLYHIRGKHSSFVMFVYSCTMDNSFLQKRYTGGTGLSVILKNKNSFISGTA